jgi:hypothetical protein
LREVGGETLEAEKHGKVERFIMFTSCICRDYYGYAFRYLE